MRTVTPPSAYSRSRANIATDTSSRWVAAATIAGISPPRGAASSKRCSAEAELFASSARGLLRGDEIAPAGLRLCDGLVEARQQLLQILALLELRHVDADRGLHLVAIELEFRPLHRTPHALGDLACLCEAGVRKNNKKL